MFIQTEETPNPETLKFIPGEEVLGDIPSVYFKDSEKSTIDGLLSLTGFSLVGGPAYNDSEAAVSVLKELNLPYVAAHPLEFQTLPQWSSSSGGLGPIETTMLVALPELDGAINPTVFAGRYGNSGKQRAMAPCNERINILAERCKKLILLKKKPASINSIVTSII